MTGRRFEIDHVADKHRHRECHRAAFRSVEPIFPLRETGLYHRGFVHCSEAHKSVLVPPGKLIVAVTLLAHSRPMASLGEEKCLTPNPADVFALAQHPHQ